MPKRFSDERVMEYTMEIEIRVVRLTFELDAKAINIAKILNLHPMMIYRWRQEYREGNNQVLLRLGYETMRRRSELCAFKFEDIDCAPNGKPIIGLNFSKTDQYGTNKVLTISKVLLSLLNQWKGYQETKAIS